MSTRPYIHSPSSLHPRDDWSPEYDPHQDAISPSSAYIVNSPSAIPLVSPTSPPSKPSPHPTRSPSDDDPSFDPAHPQSPNLSGLPDPSQYPDPYPIHPPHRSQGTSTPALSSADSSSASTRSSAYTNSARSGDYGHVNVVDQSDDPHLTVGITTDDVAQLLAKDPASSSSPSPRPPPEPSRWPDVYTNSLRSRSSSGPITKPDSTHDTDLRPPLHTTPSFDMNWQPVDERDEIGLTSEDETDDDALPDDNEHEDEELPTSAMIIAEEGLGVIVRGDDTPIVQLQVHPATTHLLIGSSNTPNAVPSFLANHLPHITTTLLALDISANFLVALPPALASCICLEELNIASNPLRALPVFLSGLTSLKVLIADSAGLTTLPPALNALDKLHSLSIRRNKMNSLPSWLCLLPALETLLVDGNPFQGPWKALVEPLLAKSPMTPLYPPSTPIFPLPSASIQSNATETDVEDLTDSPMPDRDNRSPPVPQEEEDTIMPFRAPNLARSVTSPVPIQGSSSPSPTLSRTRTTPNKAYYDKTRAASKSVVERNRSAGHPTLTTKMPGDAQSADREVRKMKSAGELRRNFTAIPAVFPPSNSATSSPQRPTMSHYATSASSSNLLQVAPPPQENQMPKRFASLGVTSGMLAAGNRQRAPVDRNIWGSTSGDEAQSKPPSLPAPHNAPVPRSLGSSPPRGVRDSRYPQESEPRPPPPLKEEKSNRWGFLKKMSMGKMRSDPPSSRPSTAHGRLNTSPYSRTQLGKPGTATEAPRVSVTPQIDVRISTADLMLNSPVGYSVLPPSLSKKPSSDALRLISPSVPPPPIPEVPPKSPQDAPKSQVSNMLLVPPTSTPRAAKRRSFLPFDSPLPIPAAASFVPGVTATNDADDGSESSRATPSPVIPHESLEQIQRREEEKAREARTRALRSVMAYLRDMYDLGLTQVNTMSMYGGAIPDAIGLRSRRPTVVENGRSEASMSTYGTRPESSAHLRSSEVRMGIRSGTTTQTNSVATTDSNGSGSGEERKYKDDKGKRARIVREIVETERTYVRGLQELVDIYIRPAAAPVNVLSGVGQSKDTVLPAAERKIVFNGLESLFSFHKESFLPSLERAAAPLMRPTAEIASIDVDGQTSLQVARAVAQIFVSHAAFMRMYSTYINNFDNSVQRIKAWTSDRPTGSPVVSPSTSSTQQLVGLGLAISAVTAPALLPDTATHNLAPLSSSQRKRIKSYLKRCRMNPRHSQLNLEGYLLLPVQRIPRYKLLLEELVRSCPPMYEYMEDPLDRALSEIAVLATNMNEGKRESESRRKLVLWQSRIRGKFPSPLVQPHRRLIMDGPLHLTRVVRKATVSFEVIDSKGDASTVQVECLSPELTPRPLIGVLCNDLLVLCRDPSEGQDPNSQVDLWAVLRMQTLPQPASIVHGNALRLVDNKAILYFDALSTSDALTWYRAINLNMASKA